MAWASTAAHPRTPVKVCSSTVRTASDSVSDFWPATLSVPMGSSGACGSAGGELTRAHGATRVRARRDAPARTRDRAEDDVVRAHRDAVELAPGRGAYRRHDGRRARDSGRLPHALGAV